VLGYDALRDAGGETDLSETHGRGDRQPWRPGSRNHPCGTGQRRRVHRPGGQQGFAGASILNETRTLRRRAGPHPHPGRVGPSAPRRQAEIAGLSIAAETHRLGSRVGGLTRQPSDGPREAIDPVCGNGGDDRPQLPNTFSSPAPTTGFCGPGCPYGIRRPERRGHDGHRRSGAWQPAPPAAWAGPNSCCRTGIRPCSGATLGPSPRAAGFDQLIVTLGGAAGKAVRRPGGR